MFSKVQVASAKLTAYDGNADGSTSAEIASAGAASDYLGYSVAISEDAIVVGANSDSAYYFDNNAHNHVCDVIL
jgi:hypothetical protein